MGTQSDTGDEGMEQPGQEDDQHEEVRAADGSTRRHSPIFGGTNYESWWTSRTFQSLSGLTGGAGARPLRLFGLCINDDLGTLSLSADSLVGSAGEWVGRWFYTNGQGRVCEHRLREGVHGGPFELC